MQNCGPALKIDWSKSYYNVALFQTRMVEFGPNFGVKWSYFDADRVWY